MAEIFEGTFSIFQEGRKYTGHHRKYVADNVQAVFESGRTQEELRNRELFGFLGHGRRQLARKVKIGEVEPVKLPDGRTIIVENIPSNVTVELGFDPKTGKVHHKQEILESEPGKAVCGLIKSKVGGWSWAMGGKDGGSLLPTTTSDFHGFDYVFQPGFTANRSYILEDITGGMGRDQILESLQEAGVTEERATDYLDHWLSTEILHAYELSDKLERATVYESALIEERENLKAELEAYKTASEKRKKLIAECARESIYAMPENFVDAMLRMETPDDWQVVTGFYESAARKNPSRLPLPGVTPTDVMVDDPRKRTEKPVEYGDVRAAQSGDIRVFGNLKKF